MPVPLHRGVSLWPVGDASCKGGPGLTPCDPACMTTHAYVVSLPLLRRGGRVAEGDGLLNRYRGSTSIVGSNPIPSAISKTCRTFPQGVHNGFCGTVPDFVPTPRMFTGSGQCPRSVSRRFFGARNARPRPWLSEVVDLSQRGRRWLGGGPLRRSLCRLISRRQGTE